MSKGKDTECVLFYLFGSVGVSGVIAMGTWGRRPAADGGEAPEGLLPGHVQGGIGFIGPQKTSLDSRGGVLRPPSFSSFPYNPGGVPGQRVAPPPARGLRPLPRGQAPRAQVSPRPGKWYNPARWFPKWFSIDSNPHLSISNLPTPEIRCVSVSRRFRKCLQGHNGRGLSLLPLGGYPFPQICAL